MIEYAGFSSSQVDQCNYTWNYTASLSDGSSLDADIITFDSDYLVFVINTATVEAQVLTVVLNGSLSDGVTSDQIEFNVTFTLEEDDPYYYIDNSLTPQFLDNSISNNELSAWNVKSG